MQLLIKNRPVIFISDLHLNEDRPDITQAFLSFIKALIALPKINQPQALYILGDLFELWCGDDENTELHQQIAQAFNSLNQTNIPCYFQHGNRDFALGLRYAKSAQINLLPENHVINLFGIPTLLTHGDLLCTKDLNYLRMRKYLHNPIILRLIHLLPLRVRQKLVDNIRQTSIKSRAKTLALIQENPSLAAQILDKYNIEESTVETNFKHFSVQQIIHGHTHKPDIHYYEIDQKTCIRIVLDDWDQQAGIIYFDENGFTRQQFKIIS